LKPQNTFVPSAENNVPPTTAPSMPSAMLMKQPSPCRFTIMLAIQPVISPKKIQPSTDMATPPNARLKIHDLA
jgi:hypothetical protein